jgi:hypothetical protein
MGTKQCVIFSIVIETKPFHNFCTSLKVLTDCYHFTATEQFLWLLNVASNSKAHLGLRVKGPMFFPPDFNQIWTS